MSAAPHVRLLNRDFVLLWQGQLLSQVGSQAFVIALLYWTMEATGSASVMAALVIVSTLPAVLLGPFTGVLADRFSRMRIIVLGDVARGVIMLGVAFAAGRGEPEVVIATLFAGSLVGGVIGAVFNPAIGAAVPDLVPPAGLTRANSIMQLSGQAAVVLGQAAAGVLYRVLGAPLLFLIDGVSFVVSGASEAFIRLPHRPAVGAAPDRVVRSYVRDAREGFSFIRGNVGLRTLVLTATLLNFVFTPVFVLLPFFVRDVLHADAAWYGFLLGALSAGSIAGTAAAGFVAPGGEGRARVVSGAFLLLPVLLLALAVSRTAPATLVILFAAGALSGLINVVVITLVQVTSPPEMRGRVLSIVLALAQAAMPAGLAIGGVAADVAAVGVPPILAAFGIAGVLAVTAALRSAPLHTLLALEPSRAPVFTPPAARPRRPPCGPASRRRGAGRARRPGCPPCAWAGWWPEWPPSRPGAPPRT